MLSLFRNFFQSKIGLPIFIVFLGVVAIAFASADVSGVAGLGGLTGDDKVAVVGDESVSGAEVSSVINQSVERQRQQNPGLTVEQYVAAGAFEGELNLLIERSAIGQFARKYGLRAGEDLVNREIQRIPAFHDLTGVFDEDVYRAALARQRITHEELSDDIANGLLAQQVLSASFAVPQVPDKMVRQYASVAAQRRQGQIGLVPAMQYAPEGDPSDEQLAAFYTENRSDYILPERRSLRFASFGAEKVTANVTPSNEAIAERFERDAETYAAQERRAISSFVVPTQEAAQALVDRVRAGTSLEDAARDASFQISSSEPRDREATNAGTSFAVGEAVFAAEEGDIIDPAQSALGWYVARVDTIEREAARSLDQVRGEIVEQLQAEALAAALAELSTQIEDKVNDGASLSDVAQEFGLETNVIPGVMADGQIFGAPGQSVPPALTPIIETSFQMDEGNPQLAELVPGVQFILFDVNDITASNAPPLEGDVRRQVAARWKIVEGNKVAKAAADRITQAVRDGASLADAMRAENAALSQIENINMRRTEISVGRNGRPAAALALLFSMAQGTTKSLEDSNNLGWYVIDLDTIEVDAEALTDENLAQVRNDLTRALVGEYSAQFTDAVEAEIGVERNEDAIEALRTTLSGGN